MQLKQIPGVPDAFSFQDPQESPATAPGSEDGAPEGVGTSQGLPGALAEVSGGEQGAGEGLGHSTPAAPPGPSQGTTRARAYDHRDAELDLSTLLFADLTRVREHLKAAEARALVLQSELQLAQGRLEGMREALRVLAPRTHNEGTDPT